MSILAAIRNHSGTVFLGVQTLLGAVFVADIAGYYRSPNNSIDSTLHSVSLVAVVGAAILLLYLKRMISYRLLRASLAEEERRRLTETDLATGALMRHVFLSRLKEDIGTLSNQRNAILALVDLDHLKQLNDSLGHTVGDLALSHLVDCIERCFPGCPVGRLGGDEFAVLMAGDDAALCNRRLQRMLTLLRDGKMHEGNRISLSASIGIAMAPDHASLDKELILLADLALYESKNSGRGRATVFDPDMLSEKRRRRFVERELRAAMYLRELELHYQPIRQPDGSIYAFEALIRWNHSVRGLVGPAEFIPIAERSSLIDALGEWVFRRACEDIAILPGCRISINISGEQLKRQEVVDMMTRVLAETGRSAGEFTLEITETVATSATAEVIARLQTLRAMGFRVALDDFGTGNCGFNYITSLPVDCIKIDRSYVHNLKNDRVAQVFVSALIEIARIQDLAVVAEGIETEAEFSLARAAGCNRFQGYLLGRPVPPLAARRELLAAQPERMAS